MSKTSVCHCPAYPWPHRKTSGKCIWNPGHLEPHCEDCGQVCEYTVTREDLNDVWCLNSTCCTALVVQGGSYVRAEDN